MAQQGLHALACSALAQKKPTLAQESHFLCNWMVEALKNKTFPKCLAKDFTLWIRDARSKGAAANLKGLLQRINYQYGLISASDAKLGQALTKWLDILASEHDFLIITDTAIEGKLKLDNDGLPSLIISSDEFDSHISNDDIIKPITLYIRGNEALLATTALAAGLLLSQGDKKSSLIKHHKAYKVAPKNQLSELGLLVDYLPQET